MKLPFFKLAWVLGLAAILGFSIFGFIQDSGAYGTIANGQSCASSNLCVKDNLCVYGTCRTCRAGDETNQYYTAQCTTMQSGSTGTTNKITVKSMVCTPESVSTTTNGISCVGEGAGGSGRYGFKWNYSTNLLKKSTTTDTANATFYALANVNGTATITVEISDLNNASLKATSNPDTVVVNTGGGTTTSTVTITCTPTSLVYYGPNNASNVTQTTCRATISPARSGVTYTWAKQSGPGEALNISGNKLQLTADTSQASGLFQITATANVTGSPVGTKPVNFTNNYTSGSTSAGSLTIADMFCTYSTLTYDGTTDPKVATCSSSLGTSTNYTYVWTASSPGIITSGASSGTATVTADKTKSNGDIIVTLTATEKSTGKKGTKTDTIKFTNAAVTATSSVSVDYFSVSPKGSSNPGYLNFEYKICPASATTTYVIDYGTGRSSAVQTRVYCSTQVFAVQGYADGTYTAKITATAADGTTAERSVTFTWSNSATKLTIGSSGGGTVIPPATGDNTLVVTAPTASTTAQAGGNLTVSWTGIVAGSNYVWVRIYSGTPPTDAPNKGFSSTGWVKLFALGGQIATSRGSYTDALTPTSKFPAGSYFAAVGVEGKYVAYSPAFQVTAAATNPAPAPVDPTQPTTPIDPGTGTPPPAPAAANDLKITAPAANAAYKPGDNITITWTGTAPEFTDMYLALFVGTPPANGRDWPGKSEQLFNNGSKVTVSAGTYTGPLLSTLADGDYFVGAGQGTLRTVFSPKFVINKTGTPPTDGTVPGAPPGTAVNDFHFTAPAVGAPHAPGDTLTVSWAGTLKDVTNAFIALYKGTPLAGVRTKWPEADGRPSDGPHWVLNNGAAVNIVTTQRLENTIPDVAQKGPRLGLPLEDGDDYYLVAGAEGKGIVASPKFSIRKRTDGNPPGTPPGSGVNDFHFTAPTLGAPHAPGDTLTVAWAGTIQNVRTAYLALYKGTPLTGLRQKWPEDDGRSNDGPHWILNNSQPVDLIGQTVLTQTIPDTTPSGKRTGLPIEDGDDYYLVTGVPGQGVMASPKFSIRRRTTTPPSGGAGNPPGSTITDFHFTAPTAGSPFAPGDPITIAWLGQLTGVRDAYIALYKGTPYTSLRTKWPEEDGKTNDGPYHLFNNGQIIDITSRDRLVENIPVNATRGLRAGLPLEDSDNYYLVIGDSGKKVAYSSRFSIRNRAGNGNNTGSNVNPSISYFRVVGNSTRAVNDTVYFEYYVCDANNDPLTLEVNFGDGVVQSVTGQCVANQVSHVYRNTGTYPATLTARDNRGGQSQASATITIQTSSLTQYGLSDGMLVRTPGNPRVYHIMANQNRTKLMKHWLPDSGVFISYGYRWDDIRIVDDSILNPVPRVKVVKLANSSDLYYLTEGDMKRKIPNDTIFRSYGNVPEDTVTINQTEYNWYPVNILVHIDRAPEIYLLENGQKRWIKTEAAFKNRGYTWAMVAPVNQTEFNYYPTGSPIQ